MNNEEVTKGMDFISWLGEHWGWFGALIIYLITQAQNHLRIKTLEGEVKILRENNETLIRLEEKIDWIITQVGENKDDIKEISRGSRNQT